MKTVMYGKVQVWGGAFALYSILNGNVMELYNDISTLYERLSS